MSGECFVIKTQTGHQRILKLTKSLWPQPIPPSSRIVLQGKNTLLQSSWPRGVHVNFTQNVKQQLHFTEQHKVMESHPSPVHITETGISRMKPPVSAMQAPEEH